LNALPAREQDILDSFPLFRFVLLTTICPFSGSSGTGCQIAEDIPKFMPIRRKNHTVNFQPSILEPRLSTENSILQ